MPDEQSQEVEAPAETAPAEAEILETPEETEPTKPTETVEFWKAQAREQEKRAKANDRAAKKLAEIEEAQKTELQKLQERAESAEGALSALNAAQEIREAKDALGQKYGLTPQSIQALRGTDLDDLEEHAKLLKALQPEPRTPGHVPGEGRTVTTGTGDPAQQFADLIRNARK